MESTHYFGPDGRPIASGLMRQKVPVAPGGAFNMRNPPEAAQTGGHGRVVAFACLAAGVLGFSLNALYLGGEIVYLVDKWPDLFARIMWCGVSIAVTLGAVALVQLCAAEWSRPGMTWQPIPKALAALVLIGLTWWQISGALAHNAAKTATEAARATPAYQLAEKRIKALDAELARLDAQDAAIDPAAERAAAEKAAADALDRQTRERQTLNEQRIRYIAMIAAQPEYAEDARRALRGVEAQIAQAKALTLEPAREAAERVATRRAEIAQRRVEVEEARAKALPDYERGVWAGKYERTMEHKILAAIFLLVAELLVAVRGIAAETAKERQRRHEDEALAKAATDREKMSEAQRLAAAKRVVFEAGLDLNQLRIARARELMDAGMKMKEAAELMAQEASPRGRRGPGVRKLFAVDGDA